MRIILSGILLIVLVCSPLLAQNEAPIDPATIFDPSVTIRYVSAEVEPSPTVWDNDLHQFAIDGVVSPYPPGVATIKDIETVDADTLAVTIDPDVMNSYDAEVWLYSRRQQTLSPFVAQCATADGQPDEGWRLVAELWTIIVQDESAALCNRLTGATSAPLPENYRWPLESIGRSGPITSVSPDRKYVAFIGQIGAEWQPAASRQIEVFSYETQTGTILSLGIMEAATSLDFGQWIGNQITIVTGENDFVEFSEVWIADVTRSKNLEFAFNVTGGGPGFEEYPPRYLIGYNPYTNASGCGRTTYYVETHETVELDLDGLCHPEYGDIEGVGYYRDVPFGESRECCTPAPAKVVEVPFVRYDTRTSERQELYRGEIEAVYWVSPNEQYAILLLDQDGEIDFFPYLDAFNYQQLGLPYLALVDLQTGETLATTPMDELAHTWGLTSDTDWAVNHTLTPLPDGTFLKIYCDENDTPCARDGNAASRVTITASGVEETLLVKDPIMLTPDQKGLFVWSQPRSKYQPAAQQQGVNIYDLETGQLRPFIRELSLADYDFELLRSGKDSVQVFIYRKSSSKQHRPDASFSVYFEPDGREYVLIQSP
ncbi:MAG TPA: hypothetical protein VHO69_13130 [Phototrophicaceae bacterium]|nr:hypothetical protein [Phototrophicaceae bacterium]